ncbi:MAG: hypothetical protein HKN10_16375 [Myxococcales bacterium]|nr:hypothetical protein [Myxococcales bacterium]
MTGISHVRRNGAVALLAALALAALLAWLHVGATPSDEQHAIDDYPELFVDLVVCPVRGDPLSDGRRLEELGLLLADRYPYDAGDGVRAVQRYREAESCYRVAGSHSDAARVGRLITVLAARVDTDYAAARLNLVTALDQGRWSDGLSEIHRLLLFTEHVRRHGYVEWLNKIIGKLVARASTND